MKEFEITAKNKRHNRNLIDQNFKFKAKFFVNNKFQFSGSVYDISVYGLCLMITNVVGQIKEMDYGKIFLERLSSKIEIDATIKWIDKKSETLIFVGFETKNLLLTNLRDFI